METYITVKVIEIQKDLFIKRTQLNYHCMSEVQKNWVFKQMCNK